MKQRSGLDAVRYASTLVTALAALFLNTASARAQQRPLVTEDPETIGSGRVLREAGFDHQREIFFPASGLTGNLFRAPTLGVSSASVRLRRSRSTGRRTTA